MSVSVSVFLPFGYMVILSAQGVASIWVKALSCGCEALSCSGTAT